jgi:large subunit ribosomal protein L44
MKQAVKYADALASVPRALTALIYHHRSLAVARKFAHTFFLSRLVDLKGLIKFRDPKLALSFTVEQFGRERPISRQASRKLDPTPKLTDHPFNGHTDY